MQTNKAIFFDRDGVLNKAIMKNNKPFSPKTLKQLEINPDANMIIKYAKKKKFLTFMITNQPDVARGENSKKNVDKINLFIKKKLNIDDIFCCYCSDNQCKRRKPNPGMLIEAKKKWNISFKKSFLIGDRKKDIDAAKKVKIKSIFIDYNYDEKKPTKPNFVIYTLKQFKKIKI
jgi:D-glycero-D-manno-heptose 1,7-bisphosphate phosphatase